MPDTIAAEDIEAEMRRIAEAARAAMLELGVAGEEAKNAALHEAAAGIRDNAATLLEANARDLDEAGADLTESFLDRLKLDDGRIAGMAKGLEEIAALPDPVGTEIAAWDRPNGLRIARVRVPLGVIGIIYESRPNVTADAGGLCLKSGNAVILRGGSESFHSSGAIMDCLHHGLRQADLPEAAIQRVPTRDRAAVGAMLTMPDLIDIIVPRGGKSLIERVQNESRIPVIAHLDGNCHVYIEADADPEMARQVAVNAKMRRPGICGAAETLLIDESIAAGVLPPILAELAEAGCEIRGDAATGLWIPAWCRRARPTGTPNSSMPSSRSSRLQASTRRSNTSTGTARTTPIRSSPGMRRAPSASSIASIRRSCCTMPRPSSPTAASSAWAPKSVSRPDGCMRAVRSASNSSPRTSTWCAVPDRCGPDGSDLYPPRLRRARSSGRHPGGIVQSRP